MMPVKKSLVKHISHSAKTFNKTSATAFVRVGQKSVAHWLWGGDMLPSVDSAQTH